MTFRDGASGRITHPEYVDGKSLWIDPEVQDIIDRLHNGDSMLGWEGDPALALYRTERGEWELCRYENGQYSLVCRSRSGMPLDQRLIMHLVAHDMRRKSALKQVEEMNALNAAVDKAREDASVAALTEITEKVYWAANKDIGHHY